MNRRGVIVETEGDVELQGKSNHVDGMLKTFDDEENEEVREFEQNRRDYIIMLRELRKKHPNMAMEQLESMARDEVLNKGPKSRAFYRIQATRKLMGGGNMLKKQQEKEKSDLSEAVVEVIDDHITKICFNPGHYTVMENVGTFEVTVVREGGDPNQIVLVDYGSEDGSANAGADYIGVSGTLVFGPGEREKKFSIEVLDDDVFEEDEHFYVRLTNLRYGRTEDLEIARQNGEAAGQLTSPSSDKSATAGILELVSPSLATVMILDDDHGGIFSFAEKDTELVESVGQYELRVVRWSGARGRVALPYALEDGTAKAGKEFEADEGEIIFENNESE
jgi:solute carrier family 8 (sodium/calcium exchanger)